VQRLSTISSFTSLASPNAPAVMSSCFSGHPEHGHFYDPRSQISGRLNKFGQVAVQFHHNPERLERWFKNAQRNPVGSKDTPKRPQLPSSQNQYAHTHPPRLHIAIHICGSRGDVQPFIPIAKLLQAPPYGYRVRICTHPTFKDFIVSIIIYSLAHFH
jgi:sterol 3beta-glucosyltransferase